ncbi:GntR family transcriptional regulator [Eubacteriales bacterium OttesenSCG-928-K08]|nr:GntR family transcriptional regulator [Eubacteriales bacterium OttesenSCG-928-K08]
MEFSKLNAPTLKELFVKELEAMILSGKLEIGQKLPPERELALSMQVSRAVVNSGISELARKGFLHVKPRSGVYVADYRRYGTAETLLSIMHYNGGHLRRAEVRSILEIKIIVDRLAVELAVEKLSQEDIDALKSRLDALAQMLDVEQAASAAFDFYHELALISGNFLLPLIYRSFRIPITHLWMRFVRKYEVSTIHQSACGIFAALEKRDKEAAVLAVENAVRASIGGDREIYED